MLFQPFPSPKMPLPRLASFYRSLPNFNLIRPADAEECSTLSIAIAMSQFYYQQIKTDNVGILVGAWEIALEAKDTPSLFCLSRQPVPLLDSSNRSKVKLGAYPVFHNYIPSSDQDLPDLILVATGSEVSLAIAATKLLPKTLRTRVVSMPSQRHFDSQPSSYRRSVLGTGHSLVVAVEAWSSYGWARYAHASLSMHTFGMSAPQQTLYEIFGFGAENVRDKVTEFVEKCRGSDGRIRLPGVGEFEELLLGYVQVHGA